MIVYLRHSCLKATSCFEFKPGANVWVTRTMIEHYNIIHHRPIWPHSGIADMEDPLQCAIRVIIRSVFSNGIRLGIINNPRFVPEHKQCRLPKHARHWQCYRSIEDSNNYMDHLDPTTLQTNMLLLATSQMKTTCLLRRRLVRFWRFALFLDVHHSGDEVERIGLNEKQSTSAAASTNGRIVDRRLSDE